MGEYWRPIHEGSAVHSTCLNCPPRPGVLRFRDDPSPGFGIVGIYRDGENVAGTCGPAATLIRKWRGVARGEPDHDEVIHNGGSGPGGHNISRAKRARRAHSKLLVFTWASIR